jgi:hypothetical protein
VGNELEIDDVEHLFTRINNGGSRIDPDDLQYSMIKAYWPEVKPVIDSIQPRRLAESRLVVLGARLALSRETVADGQSPLHGPIGIGELRKFASEGSDGDHYPLIRDALTNFDQRTARIVEIIKVVQKWLSWDKYNRPYGLPPVLVTSIARSSGDVFLLLMWIADIYLKRNQDVNCDILCRRIIGIATNLHWFSINQSRAVTAIAKEINRRIQEEIIITSNLFDNLITFPSAILDNSKDHWFISPISPEAFSTAISLPNADTLNDWRWWKDVQSSPKLIDKVKSNKEILLYSQREYICREFHDYDPARKDSWDYADRPWDFDHILPKAVIDYRDIGNHKETLKAWATERNCIANLRAWWREQNRSDQAILPSNKIDNDQIKLYSFINDRELQCYSECAEQPHEIERVISYITASKNRLTRIYAEWHDTLDIRRLYDAGDK